MKIWCYHDIHGWGETLRLAAEKQGHDVQYCDDPRQPDEGLVFWHMHHEPTVRKMHKRAFALMKFNPKLTLVPTYEASILFDDKVEQARVFSGWTPRTNIFYTPAAARAWLDSESTSYPFMSKAAEGTKGHNVRRINTYSEANEEIRLAFSDRGIRLRYAQSQKSYLLWQQFVQHDYDIRIISVGSRRLVQRRLNNNGELKSITVMDEECASALAYANKLLERFNMKSWCSVDLVSDGKRWYVLDMTVSWNMEHYKQCTFFSWDAKPGDTGLVRAGKPATGRMMFDIFVEELSTGQIRELVPA